MSVQDALQQAGAKPKGRRPYFLKDPDVERVMAITMAVAQELSVVRQRLDTVERLLDKNGTISRDDIENFTPTKEEAAERGLWTEEYIARVLRIIQQEREALANGKEISSGEFGEELDRDS
jgi:pantoate kinase